MAGTTESVTIHVAGERLTLRTDRGAAFLTQLAEHVTSEVDKIRAASSSIPRQRVFLLVALKLADELYGERELSQAMRNEVVGRTDLMLQLLDDGLAELDANAE